MIKSMIKKFLSRTDHFRIVILSVWMVLGVSTYFWPKGTVIGFCLIAWIIDAFRVCDDAAELRDLGIMVRITRWALAPLRLFIYLVFLTLLVLPFL